MLYCTSLIPTTYPFQTLWSKRPIWIILYKKISNHFVYKKVFHHFLWKIDSCWPHLVPIFSLCWNPSNVLKVGVCGILISGMSLAILCITILMFLCFLVQLCSFRHQFISESLFLPFSFFFSLLSLVPLSQFHSPRRCLPLAFPWPVSLKTLYCMSISVWRSSMKRSTMKRVISFCQRRTGKHFESSSYTWLITRTRMCRSCLA